MRSTDSCSVRLKGEGQRLGRATWGGGVTLMRHPYATLRHDLLRSSRYRRVEPHDQRIQPSKKPLGLLGIHLYGADLMVTDAELVADPG
jgi:hypothetical protein